MRDDAGMGDDPVAGDDAALVTEFDGRITAALATAPEFLLPEGFAARVAASVPETRAATPPRYGRAATLACGVLLAVALLWLVSAGAKEPMWLTAMLSVELAVLSLGWGVWWQGLGWPL